MAKDKIVIVRFSEKKAEVNVLMAVAGQYQYLVKKRENKTAGSSQLTQQLINLAQRKAGKEVVAYDDALLKEADRCRRELIDYDSEFAFADGSSVEIEQYEFENATLAITNSLLEDVNAAMGNASEVDRMMILADEVDVPLLKSRFVRNFSATVGNSRAEAEWLSINDKNAVEKLLAEADAPQPKPEPKTEPQPKPKPQQQSEPKAQPKPQPQPQNRPRNNNSTGIIIVLVAVLVAIAIGCFVVTLVVSNSKSEPKIEYVVRETVTVDTSDVEVAEGEAAEYEETVAPSESTAGPKTRYDYVYSESDGLRKVEKNGKKGFIDASGREVVAPQYDYIYSKSDGLYKVEKNGKKGFIRPDGTVFVAVKYDYIYSKSDGVYKVELNNKKGFVDAKTGKEICPPKYDYIYSKSDGLIKVELNNKKGFLDANYKEILAPTYDYIYSFSGGLAKVELRGKVGYINKQGKLVSPLQ